MTRVLLALALLLSHWVSEGFSSPCQPVYRAGIGPFSETNATTCLNAFDDVIWSIASGRRYTVGQQGTGTETQSHLRLVDEGPMP